MNTTKGVATHLWDSFNETFNGFTNKEIYTNSLWKIEPKSQSTTIAINPDIFDELNYQLCSRYGEPQDNAKHGLIYRTILPNSLQNVIITCYASTCTISVQGMGHSAWVEKVLPELGECISSDSLLSDDDHEHDTCITSTPVPKQSQSTSTPVPQQSQSSSTASINFSLNFENSLHHRRSSNSVQTEATAKMTSETQTSVKTSCKQIQTSHSGDTESKLRKQHRDAEEQLQLEIKRLTNANNDLNKQLAEFRELRTSYVQLCSAFKDLSDRNAALEAKVKSLEESNEPSFILPKKCTPAASSAAHPTPMHLSFSSPNKFDALPMEESAPPPCTPSQVSQPPPASVRPKQHKSNNCPTQKPANKKETLHAPTPSKPKSYAEAAQPKPSTHQSPPSTTDSPKPSAPRKRQVALIMGDSIPKGLIGRRLSRRYQVVNYSLPGSTPDMWIKFAPSILSEIQPDIVIVHCGTNSINQDPASCMNSLQLLGEQITKNGNILLAFSGLTTQINMARHSNVVNINHALIYMCKLKGWTYICNENINLNHIQLPDGIHLKPSGVKLLAKNYIQFLRGIQAPFYQDVAM